MKLSLLQKRIALAGGLLLFFLLYAYLPYLTAASSIVKLDSPDETANYYFIKLFARTGEFSYSEPLLAISNHHVHPRSMTAVRDKVAPVSFLGMIVLYGLSARGLGERFILYLTPLLAVLSSIPFYFLIKKIFSQRVAAISSLLLLLHPAYWYFSARSMLPNILFTDLCIAGFALLVYAKRPISYAGSGLLLGLALMVRLSEVFWIAGALLLMWILNCVHVRFIRPALFLIGFALPVVLLLFLNQHVYGNPISFGYQTLDTSTAIKSIEHIQALVQKPSLTDAPSILGEARHALLSLAAYILPFGFVPKTIAVQVRDYFVLLFWWFIAPLVLGTVYIVKRGIISSWHNRRIAPQLTYTALFALIAAWLFIFYGSWLIHDNITKEITIGNSYIRYWLPIFAMSLPLIASFFIFIIERASLPSLQVPLIGILFGASVFFSFHLVFSQTNESLFSVVKQLQGYREKALAAVRLTEDNAVIFSSRSDKIFFPERKVAALSENFAEVPLVRELFAQVPVYYNGMWSESDAAYISKRYFKPLGYELRYTASLDESDRLYKVVKQ